MQLPPGRRPSRSSGSKDAKLSSKSVSAFAKVQHGTSLMGHVSVVPNDGLLKSSLSDISCVLPLEDHNPTLFEGFQTCALYNIIF